MFNSLSNWVNGIATEIKAISWPSRKRVYNDTVIVVIALIISGTILGLIDFGFTELFKMAISKIG
ncbi:MAG: preprotein translocase subunit SecE [Candidatus Berkelbacteria bacterium]|nr:preprotein translocase subunit SecE [Candidatus Berkelbacteria bacterium]